jgi:hypothetical protein
MMRAPSAIAAISPMGHVPLERGTEGIHDHGHGREIATSYHRTTRIDNYIGAGIILKRASASAALRQFPRAEGVE